MSAYQKSKGIYKVPFIGGFFDDRLDKAAQELEKSYQWAEGEYDQLRGDQGLTSLETGPSAFESMQLDNTGTDAQKQALAALLARGEARGMDDASRAALEEAAYNEERRLASQRAGLMARARGAGVENAGSTLAAQLSGADEAAMRNRMAGVQAAGDAQIRGLQAYLNAGNMGGQMRAQNFQEESSKASAKDLIDRFNATMRNQMFQNRMDLTGKRTGARVGGANAGYEATTKSQAQDAGIRGGVEKLAAVAAGALTGGLAAPALLGAASAGAGLLSKGGKGGLSAEQRAEMARLYGADNVAGLDYGADYGVTMPKKVY